MANKGKFLAGKAGSGSGLDRANLYNLQREVEGLRSILLHLLHCHANGEPVDLNLGAIRDALYISEEASVEEVLERLRRTHATVEGKKPCPSCQSMVELRAGVQPKCMFCGTVFGTEKEGPEEPTESEEP